MASRETAPAACCWTVVPERDTRTSRRSATEVSRTALARVGSVAGYGGLPKATVYGPSKAALINFAEVLHLDLAPRGIDVFPEEPCTESPLFGLPVDAWSIGDEVRLTSGPAHPHLAFWFEPKGAV